MEVVDMAIAVAETVWHGKFLLNTTKICARGIWHHADFNSVKIAAIPREVLDQQRQLVEIEVT